MSDNVILAKHFDSLASAVQRYMSAGFVPIAGVPAGRECVIDNVPSTVDGGLWYEADDRIPTLKMHYGGYDFVVNLSVSREAALIFDLNVDKSTAQYYDTCGNTWTKSSGSLGFSSGCPFDSTYESILVVGFGDANRYLEREGNVTLGGKDFTVRFFRKIPGSLAQSHANFLHFYNSAGEEVFSVFEDYIYDSSAGTQTTTYGLTFAGTTYTFPTTAVKEENVNYLAHVEFVYSHSNGELKLFYDGEAVATLAANLPATATARQLIGRPAGDTGNTLYVTAVQLYNGLALHNADFTFPELARPELNPNLSVTIPDYIKGGGQITYCPVSFLGDGTLSVSLEADRSFYTPPTATYDAANNRIAMTLTNVDYAATLTAALSASPPYTADTKSYSFYVHDPSAPLAPKEEE